MEAKELVPIERIQTMAKAVVQSGLFSQIKDVNQAVTLMLLCQAEGLHPIQALRQYNIIQGQPALKADAMLARFQDRGGKVKWLRMDDECCEAEFMAKGLESPVKVTFDLEDAKRAMLLGKQSWRQYPRAMLRARVISEGVRASDPGVNAGLYTVEEVQDFAQDRIVQSFVETAPDLTPALEASIEQAKQKKSLAEWAKKIDDGSVLVKGGSESTPEPHSGPPAEEEPPIDNEPPAIFADSDQTPEEQRALIAGAPDGEPLFGADEKHEQWLREKGLGQKCVKCSGTMEKYRSERTGRIYLQCNKAHSLREDALKEGCDEKTAKAFTRGHSYARL